MANLQRRAIRILYCLRIQYWRIFKPITLGSRALCIRNGEVCLVRLTYYKGWFLPGGGVDRGETFYDAAIREAREECGLELKNPELFGLYLNRHEGKIDHVAVYLSETPLGEPFVADTLEIAEARFFPIQRLPEGLWPGHRRRIQEYSGQLAKSPIW